MDEEAEEDKSNKELVKQRVRHHDEVLSHGDERGPFYRIRPSLNYPLHSHTRPVVAGTHGLRVIGATRGDQLSRHAAVPIPGGLRRVVWWGGRYLLGASETGRLLLFDLATPAAPRIQWQVELGTPIWDLALYGSHAYLAAGAAGVVQMPLQRAAAGQPHTIWPGAVRTLAVWGRQAYLLDADQGLVRLDLSDPAAPRQVDMPPVQVLPAPRLRLSATPTTLYLAGGQHGLQRAPLALSRTTVRIPQAIVQSRKVDTATLPIASAILRAQSWAGAYGHITYALSNNGGDTWEPVLPGVPHRFTTSGTDLR
jgi:hypothetical protein